MLSHFDRQTLLSSMASSSGYLHRSIERGRTRCSLEDSRKLKKKKTGERDRKDKIKRSHQTSKYVCTEYARVYTYRKVYDVELLSRTNIDLRAAENRTFKSGIAF